MGFVSSCNPPPVERQHDQDPQAPLGNMGIDASPSPPPPEHAHLLRSELPTLSADEWRLQRQLAYYFSEKNLHRDPWLVEQLGGDPCTGWIQVAVIAGFRRVQNITSDLEFVVKTLRTIPSLEVASSSCAEGVDYVVEAGGGGAWKVRRRHELGPRPATVPVPEANHGEHSNGVSATSPEQAAWSSQGPRPRRNSKARSDDDEDDDIREQNGSTTTLDGPPQVVQFASGNSRGVGPPGGATANGINGSTSSTAQHQSQPSCQIPGFRKVPKTGVIYVMDEAAKQGYSAATAHLWANLGQGSPETTPVKHWPASVRNRIKELVAEGKLSSEKGPDFEEHLKSALEVNAENLHYGNVNGDLALRRAVAKFYNDMYRKGKQSLYSAENVALVGGGRLALTRLCTAMDHINLGHFLPDYTAYTELLSQCDKINSIPILLNPENNFRLTLQELRREIVGKGLSALLLSNPCNPTGQLIEGEDLKNWVRLARETQCSLVLDEIYSRYVYTQRMAPSDASWRMVSAAQFVEDVNADPVILLDGLTKNWRMPGLRVCWIVGPRQVIEAVGAAGSFLDGGPSLPTQRALVPLVNPKSVVEQTILLQLLFSHKRDFLLHRLSEMGILVEHPPQGTFYCWCDLSRLPPPLNSCWGFFRTMIAEAKVIVCPGVFFDVNPGRRRKFSNYESFVRLSYGPSFAEIKRGLDAIETVIAKYQQLLGNQTLFPGRNAAGALVVLQGGNKTASIGTLSDATSV